MLNDKCFALKRCIFFPNLIRISQLCKGPFLLKRRERENKCMIQWAVLFWIPPLLLYFVNSRTRTRCTRRLENFWERYFNSPYRQIKLDWSHSFHNEQKKNYFPFSNYLDTTLHSHLPVIEIPLCWSSLICFFHSEIWESFFSADW